jgi:hypothetical protein
VPGGFDLEVKPFGEGRIDPEIGDPPPAAVLGHDSHPVARVDQVTDGHQQHDSMLGLGGRHERADELRPCRMVAPTVEQGDGCHQFAEPVSVDLYVGSVAGRLENCRRILGGRNELD